MGEAVPRASDRDDEHRTARAERNDDCELKQHESKKQCNGEGPVLLPVHHGQPRQLARADHAFARVRLHPQHAKAEREVKGIY